MAYGEQKIKLPPGATLIQEDEIKLPKGATLITDETVKKKDGIDVSSTESSPTPSGYSSKSLFGNFPTKDEYEATNPRNLPTQGFDTNVNFSSRKQRHKVEQQPDGKILFSTEPRTISKKGNLAEHMAVDRSKYDNRIGYVYNEALNGIESLGRGAVDLGVKAVLAEAHNKGILIDGKPAEVVAKEWDDFLQEDEQKNVLANSFLGAKVSPEQKAKAESEPITSAVGGLANFGVAMAGGLPAMTIQGTDMGMQSINSTEKGRELPVATKTLFGLGVGVTSAAIQDLGLGKKFGKQSDKLALKLTTSVISKLAKEGIPITKEVFEQAINSEVNNLKNKVINAGSKAAQATLIQSAVGAGMDVINQSAEKIANVATGKEIFEPSSWSERLLRTAAAAKHGAISGAILGGVSLPFSKGRNYIKDRVSESQSPTDITNLKNEITEQVKNGKMSPEEADQAYGMVDLYSQVNAKIPQGTPNRSEISDDIIRQEELKKEIEQKEKDLENVHPSLQAEPLKEITALKNQLEIVNDEIAKKATSPQKDDTYIINNEPVSEEVFLSHLNSKKVADYEYNGEDAEIIQKLKDVGGKSETTTEEISQPTELNVTPTEQGEGVVIEPPMEVPEPITIKPELPKIEVVNEEPKNEVHQPTEVKEPTITEPNKEIKTTEEGNGKEPPSEGVDEVLSEGEELSGITHADTEADRKKLGIEEYEKKPKTDEELNNAADEAIKKGVDIDKLIAKIEKDKFASDLDITILKKAKAALDAKVEANPTNENIAAVHRLVKATDIAGSEQGRGLRARQGMLPKEDSISDFFIREMENSGVDELTNAQKEKVTKEYEDIKAANEKLQSDNEALRQANAKLEAEKELKKGNYGKKTSTKKDYKAQRESLKEKLKQQFKEFQEEGQKLGIASNGGVKSFVISAQMAKTIGEIVKTHVGEVGADLKEVTKRAFDDVKDLIKGISEKDIHDVIAGVYNEKKQTRSEVAIKLRDLRDEAALVNKLDQLLRGEEPKNEKQKVQRNKQITELRNKIKEIREGNLSSERTPEQERAALQTIKTRNESEIKKIEQQLKNDVFPKEEKKSSILQDRELQKKYPDLYKAALESRDKLIKLKQQREIRLIQQEYNNRTNKQKAGDVALEALNIPRTLMSSMDYSAPLRQGAWALVSHPQIGGKNLLKMFKDSFSQKHFDRWFYETKESPEFQVMEKSNLFVADPHDYRLSAKEEAFMNNLAEKIPVVGKLIKGSERAYVGFLNRMRVDIFRNFMDVALNDGKTIENSPELYKAMAEYINSTTGRGSVGKLEAAAPILNSLFFSPRLIASRINLLTMPFNPKTYTSLPKEVRVEYFKGLSKFVGVGLSVLALAKLSGAQVEDDPRSSDFGKIRSGNTRWDIWGGFQQYIRAFAQLSTGQRKSSNLGDIQKLDGKGAFGTNRGDIVTSFARGKLAPVPSMAWDFISGKTPTGEDATIKNEAIGHLVPLMVSDMKEAVKDRGVSALFTVGVPSIFGVGTQTYQPGKSSFLFSKAEVETNPTLKSYYDRDISFPPVSKAQHKIDVDKDHPNMAKEGEKPYSLMTDKEFEDFKKYQKEGLLDGVKDERGKKVADGLKDILKSTYIVLVKDKHGSIIKHERVKGEKLPDEELKKKVSNLKENATKYALKKLKLNNKPETTTKVKKVY